MFNGEQNGEVSLTVGIDIGTTNSKVVVLEIDGNRCRERVVVRRSTPSNGAELVASVIRLMAEAAAQLDALPDAPAHAGRDVGAIGIASMAESGTMLDADFTPIGELLRWNSLQRQAGPHGEAIDGLVRGLGAAELYAATGVPIARKAPLGIWHALHTAGDDRWSPTHRWAGVADLVGLTLTGRLATDHTLAARTMAYRLPNPGTPLSTGFDPALLAAAGMRPAQLPTVLAPGEPLGSLSAGAAAAIGLPAGVPVLLAGHDHAVGAWAAGVRAPREAANSVGTAEALIRILDDGGADRERARVAGMSVARAIDGEHETLLAGNPAAGALVSWVFDRLLPGHPHEPVLAALARAEFADLGPGDRYLLPYLHGRQSPHPDPDARFAVVGRDGHAAGVPEDPAELMRLTLEGLALQLRWMDRAQTDVAGAERVPTITSLGGPGSANQAWHRIKAAVIPAAFNRVTVAEPVAAGAAMLAAVRAGLCDPQVRLPSTHHHRVTQRAYDARLCEFVDAALTPYEEKQ
jgi:xylulokinase